jgi:hypothetical protein
MTTTTVTLPDGNTATVENILKVYRSASADDVAVGMRWYRDARSLCVSLAHEYNCTEIAAIGVMAALSPRTNWDRNVMLGTTCIRDGFIDAGTIGQNMVNACRIMNGAAPLDVFKGNKVRAFYSTILDPENDELVVVDAHALSIAIGRTMSAKEQGVLARVGVYEHISALYREAAEILGILPSQVQAVTWVAWRNIKKKIRTV